MLKKKNKTPSVIEDLPRGVPTIKFDKWTTPIAMWALQDWVIKHFGSKDIDGRKIFLSAIGEQVLSIRDDRHINIFCGSRGGKGVSFIIPNLLHYLGSMFILDLKGENAAITALARSAFQKVCILDPFGITPPWVQHLVKKFNPMSHLTLDSPTLIPDAGLITDGLVEVSGGDKHWSRREKMLVKRIIVYVAVDSKFEGRRNLITVQEILNGDLKLLEEDLFVSIRHFRKERP